MAVLKNRAKMSTSTTGTGTITLGSAESGYQTFGDAGVANADVVRYVIEDGTAWEIGTGTYTATGTTLTRTVSESSNADAAIVLTGSATVFIGATAEDIPSLYAENPVSAEAPTARSNNSVAIGSSADTYSNDTLAIGTDTIASGASSSAVGHLAKTNSSSAGAFGHNSLATGQSSIALGNSYTSGADSFAAAITTNSASYGATAQGATVIGNTSKGTAERAISIGQANIASGANSTAIGYLNTSGSTSYTTAIGYYNTASAAWAMALGNSSTASHSKSVSIGDSVSSTAANQVNIGGSTQTVRISESYTLPTADGTANQVLTTDGSGAVTFATASGGGGASAISIGIKTADYTVVAGDLGKIIKYAGAGADRTVTLTAGATLGDGFYVTISNANTGADERVVIDPNGTEKFGWSNGPQTITLSRGEMVKIVWDNTNSCWIIGEGGFNLAIRNDINPAASVLVGDGTNAGFAAGYDAQATGSVSVALGRGVATGGTSVALGKGYASGTDSFAAAIANNTSTYGATGSSSVAIGQNAKASHSTAVALGGSYNTSSGVRSVTLGGEVNTASAENSYAFGVRSVADKIGQYAFGNWIGQRGGLMVLQAATTNATPKAMSSSSSGASYNNQLILPNNSAYSFSGTIIARQQAADGSNYASWEIKGALLRDANAASTVLGNGIVNKLFATSGASAWAIALTADTTNGCLKIEATGGAATDIKWVATVNTAEVTYA